MKESHRFKCHYDTVRNQWKFPRDAATHADWEYNFTCDADLCNLAAEEMTKATHDFIDFVRRFTAKFVGKGNYRPWYRGQANAAWKVLPGVLREDFIQSVYARHIRQKSLPLQVLDLERYLMKTFMREGESRVPDSTSEKKWYMLAQHHGMPTRLLDWTCSPLVALWMAVERSADDKDGIIIAMNCVPKEEKQSVVGYWTEEKQNQLMSILTRWNDPISDSFRAMMQKEAIVPITPELFGDRLIQQQARFTFHTPAPDNQELASTVGITDFYDCAEYIVRADQKKFFRTFLLMSGIQRWSLWPDLDHIARGIKEANIVIPKRHR